MGKETVVMPLAKPEDRSQPFGLTVAVGAVMVSMTAVHGAVVAAVVPHMSMVTVLETIVTVLERFAAAMAEVAAVVVASAIHESSAAAAVSVHASTPRI
jgi:hypothetical protein